MYLAWAQEAVKTTTQAITPDVLLKVAKYLGAGLCMGL